MNAVLRFVRPMRAARLYGRTSRLLRAGRRQEAIEMLNATLDMLPPSVPKSFLDPAAWSTRLFAHKLRSEIAAKLGNVPLAVASIRAGLALWRDAGLPPLGGRAKPASDGRLKTGQRS